jgi:hypothetical protein
VNIEDKDLELIERYIEGDCDQEEMATVESRRKSDPDFDRLINQQKLVRDGFEGMQLIQLQEMLENRPTRKRLVWSKVLGWAAILLLGLSGGWWWLHEVNDPSGLADQFYRLPMAEIERNDSNTPEEDPYLKGLNQFASGDFSGSLISFKKIGEDTEQYWFAQYYKAHAEYQTGDFSAARNDFDRIAASKINTLAEAAEWNALLSTLKNGEPVEERIAAILNNPDHFYHPQVKDLEEKYD